MEANLLLNRNQRKKGYFIQSKENRPSDNYARFGISVVKTEYIPDNIKIVSREVKDISADERKIENLLSILKEMEVTPIALEEIIKDLQPEYLR